MSHDTLVHRIVRPAMRAIAGTAVTPDHLTALRLATGLVAAITFARSDPGWLEVGTFLFVLSALLDRADGELARQTGRFSRFGHRFDLGADCVSTASVFIGLGLGASHGMLGAGAVALGLLAALSVVVLFWQLNVVRSGVLPGSTRNSARVLADPDDSIFAMPPLLWLFGAEVVLILASVFTSGAALWLILSARRLGSALRANGDSEHAGSNLRGSSSS